ncbi:MAG TPA: hypothetical protein VF384_19590 [Planctomycetota bacterium]
MLATGVVLAFVLGGLGVLADDNRSFVWSREDFSFVSLFAGFLTLAVAVAVGIALGGVLRRAAILLMTLGALAGICFPTYWLRLNCKMRPLQQLTLADGRTLTAYRVVTPLGFLRDFVAVRLEERTCLGLFRIDYLARELAGSATLTLVDADHVRVHFLGERERDAPWDVVLAIPAR